MSLSRHATTIGEQFTLQAEMFAKSPILHADAALSLMVEAGAPICSDAMLDVACGPGSVVAAYAPYVSTATGVDATSAMLDQAQKLANEKCLTNVSWLRGNIYELPFADAAFDIVTCRYAFHHLENLSAAFQEMLRVCGPGGRIVVCDGIASADSHQADAFNAMERFRDPSTVAFRTLAHLEDLFADAGVTALVSRRYNHRASMRRLLENSFPLNGDREGLRRLIETSIEGDLFGLNSRRDGDDVLMDLPIVILAAQKPSTPGPD